MRGGHRVVPRHEPEVIRVHADRRYQGDTDKVPTTSFSEMTANGILLGSRYRQADEFEELAAMAEYLPPYLARRVHSIFRDSNSGHSRVSLPVWDEAEAMRIGNAMEAACLVHSGGHAGITLSEGAKLNADSPNSVEIASLTIAYPDE